MPRLTTMRSQNDAGNQLVLLSSYNVILSLYLFLIQSRNIRKSKFTLF